MPYQNKLQRVIKAKNYRPIGKIFFPSWEKNGGPAKLANLQNLQAPAN